MKEGFHAKRSVVYTSMALLIINATICNVIWKGLHMMEVDVNQITQKPIFFYHPLILTIVCMFGTLFLLGLYYMTKNDDEERAEAQKVNLPTNISIWCFLFSGLLSFTVIYSFMIALTLMSVSVSNLLKGVNIIFVVVLSIIFLHKQLKKFHVFGLILLMIGILIIGIGDSVFTEQHHGNKHPELGIYLTIFGSLIRSIRAVLQDYWLHKYYVSPLKYLGFEGLFGIIIGMILLPILTHVECRNAYLCHEGTVENLNRFFVEIAKDKLLLCLIILTIIFFALDQILSLSVRKYSSAIASTVIEFCKSFFLWILGLVFSWEHFHFMQPLGFFFFVIPANMIYVQIIKLPGFEYEDDKESPNSEEEEKPLNKNQPKRLLNEEEENSP